MNPSIVVVSATLVAVAFSAAAQTTEDAARQAFQDDAHAAAGLTCAACHQQGPSYTIARVAVAPRCAACHSDATYMKRFAPHLRVDQDALYRTSMHGRQMAAGDARVATCSDCHGAHGVRKAGDARSPVAILNVARTCATCHGDAVRMAAFRRPATSFGDWSMSVHADALENGDLSAPTCSTCHGSHGATVTDVAQAANVCSQCHVREAELFAASPKKAIFEQIGQAECLACHGNHRIDHPTDAWVGLEDPAVCTTCHDAATKGADTILAMRRGLDDLTAAIDDGKALLARAERAGMLVDDGRIASREAQDRQIHSRVLVHTFAAGPFQEMVDRGLRAARESQATGERALHELQVRRRGLLAATVVIIGFLVTLGFTIRRLADDT